MAENEKIILWGKAKKLKIDNYRTMSVAALKAAIAKAEGGTSTAAASPAKRKPVATAKRKPATSPAKRKPAASKPARKATTTAAKKRTTAASAKSAPAAKAKRPTAGAAKKKVTKPAVKKTTTRKTATAKAATNGNRIPIIDSEIDWSVESRVGNGKDNRGKIMGHLRRFKGNVEKVYAKLEDQAQAMYPKTADNRKRSKAAAQDLLRWHISRIKFDFVKDTQQGRFATNGSRKRSTATTAVKKATTGPARKPARKPVASAKKRKTARK